MQSFGGHQGPAPDSVPGAGLGSGFGTLGRHKAEMTPGLGGRGGGSDMGLRRLRTCAAPGST